MRWRSKGPKRYLFCVLAGVTCAGSATASPVVPNPGFEQVQIPCPFCVSVNTPSDIPGWTRSGADGDGWIWRVGYTDADGSITTAGSGNQFVTLGGGEFVSAFASWTTTVTGLSPTTVYALSFLMASEGGNASQSITATLSNGATGAGTFSAPPSTANYWRDWVQQTLQFTASGSSATLTFSATTQQDVGLDAIAVTALPEPRTLGLLALGLLGVIARRGVHCQRWSKPPVM
jgi:hypothetical protein